MRNDQRLDGVDCVWLASDHKGQIGVFVTAGVGPIPINVLDLDNTQIEELESRLCQLPLTSQADLLVSVKRPDDFIDLAERGFYVYDWTDIHRVAKDALSAYELVAAPMKPILLSDLPPDLIVLANLLQLDGIDFSRKKIIRIQSISKYIEAKEIPSDDPPMVL